MKRTLYRRLLTAGISLLFCTLTTLPAWAADYDGYLDSLEKGKLRGWAWDKDDPDAPVTVEITLEGAGGPGGAEKIRKEANEYRKDLQDALGSANHGFTIDVDLDQSPIESVYLTVEIVTEDTLIPIEDAFLYKDGTVTRTGNNRIVEKIAQKPVSGPEGVEKQDPKGIGKEPQSTEFVPESGERGELLGTFTVTGYCSCDRCSGGHNLTYSGTVPRPNHTIAADIAIYPLGTKLMIEDVIYTVEDMGSSVNGNKLDIYFGSHQEAFDYGMKYDVNVYAVQ